MSLITSNASSSSAYEVQVEKPSARKVKSFSTSRCPLALRQAPSTLTGSLRDHTARRGPASPLCSASSAAANGPSNQALKSSRSVMQSAWLGPSGAHNHAVRLHVHAPGRPEPREYLDLRDWLRVSSHGCTLYVNVKLHLAHGRRGPHGASG